MTEPPVNDPLYSADTTSVGEVDELPPDHPRGSRSGRGFWGWVSELWELILRLAILGLGVSVGTLVGLLVAQMAPAKTTSPPWIEVTMRRANYTLEKIRDLPNWWRGNEDLSATPLPASSELATSPPSQSQVPPLSDTDQQVLVSELSALEAEVDALDNRLSSLESQLGQPPSTASAAMRIERLQQLLASDTGEVPAATPAPTPAPESSPAIAETPTTLPNYTSDPLFQLARDKVTLPTSVLFEPNQAILTANGERILDTIAPDLSRYPGATILTGSHSATIDPPEQTQELTFKQAIAVQQYLSSRLGDNYRWVAVGYGSARPIVSSSDTSSQLRNQRVEIAIVPAD